MKITWQTYQREILGCHSIHTESESPGAGPGNLDRRAQSRGNTSSFNPFIFQLKKLGFREESVLQGGSESLGA